MRTFSSRKSWGGNPRDGMSLLGTSSNADRPRPSVQSASVSNHGEPVQDSSFEKHSSFGPEKELAPSCGAIQFVPAYEDAVSPATTQPLSSPEQSFSVHDEPNLFRITTTSSSSSKRRATSCSPVATATATASTATTPTPAPAMPSPSNTLQQKSDRLTRRSTSKGSTGSTSTRQVTPPPREATSQASSAPQRKNGGTRMARLASLFSSRAIVKQLDPPEGQQASPQQPPSPPRSESSTGYVGWPGTQDKRGATVAMEQSSYEESDHRSDDASSDLYLAHALVNQTAAANSPLVHRNPSSARKPQTEADKVHRMATPMRTQVRGVGDIYGQEPQIQGISALADPWGMSDAPHEDAMSDFSTNYSKTSSAYFNPKEVRAMRSGQQLVDKAYQRKVAAAVMRGPSTPQPPTEDALRKMDHMTPSHRTFNATNAMGFRGLLDKTRDVPNLMDGTESDSTHSSISGPHSRSAPRQRAYRRGAPPDWEDQILEEVSSDIFDGVRGDLDESSDIFDGLSNAAPGQSKSYMKQSPSIPEDEQYTLGAAPRSDQNNLNLVLLGGGLTTIQTTTNDYTNRQTASDFDENLTNSDYDQYGFARIPGFNEMATAGKNVHDRSLGGSVTKILASRAHNQPSSRAREAIEKYKQRAATGGDQGSDGSGSSLFSDPYHTEGWGENVQGGLQQYYVHPDKMKLLLKKYRKMSNQISPEQLSYDDMEREEDATKAFALSEMRSRIMEKDIERGLERRGGTTVVDDLVLTPYNRTATRVRDALIVAKAWRDGATPQDVFNTALLTRRPERAHFILRSANQHHNRWDTSQSPDHVTPERYTWEEVSWADDLELAQHRCHSIGPRHLRGVEMFTIGDCQSILLKLCNEQCIELRVDLNDATARQIDAEDLMKTEGDFGGDGMMTEAEMTYLTSMEEVKIISHKLVLAEKAFSLVRDRIEKLVARYEALLVKFEDDAESIAPSSIITASSFCTDYSDGFEEERERETLSRRAQRAELSAELAAREAMLTKQRARELRKEKEMEIHILQQKLNELQSESSAAMAEREHSVVLARAIRFTANGRPIDAPPSTASHHKPPIPSINNSKIDDVKQRFRNRSAGRNSNGSSADSLSSNPGFQNTQRHQGNHQQAQASSANRERNALYRAVGEEMFQHLDFYERSLKAVETAH